MATPSNRSPLPFTGDQISNLAFRRLPHRVLPIYEIVFPLRFDVIVRAAWLRTFYVDNFGLYDDDFEAFSDLARATSNITGLQDVYLRWNWWQYHCLPAQTTLQAVFDEDLKWTVETYRLLNSLGWQSESPRIRIAVSRTPLPGIDGRIRKESQFLMTGHHRLAALLAMGIQELGPEQYEYFVFHGYSHFFTSDIWQPNYDTFASYFDHLTDNRKSELLYHAGLLNAC
jgi:hypothetical protein